jgi:2-oxoisovalerate ferredoxin oxidoreductase beta subunit
VLALPFTRLANELGDARASNMIMLGALLEIAGVLPQASVDAALRRLVKNPRWVQLDERALARGRDLYKESLAEV